MKRDANIELMRLIFMYMICMVHAVGYVPERWRLWLTNIAFAGVIGFVLISGYFGIKFKFSKALKVEGVGLGCALTVVAAAWLCGLPFTWTGALQEVLRLFKGYWFIHAYVVMMVLSSLVPSDKKLSLSACLPFFVLVYGWSFAMIIPGLQRFIPRSSGLEPYSGLTIFAAYLIGRLYRQYDCDKRFGWKTVVPVLCVSLYFVATVWPFQNFLGAFARYNSPFLAVAGVCLFWIFRKMPVSGKLTPILSLITPSILSIYLIHCNDYGYRAFAFIEAHIGNGNMYATCLVLAAIAFVGGLLLDLPRRLAVTLFKNLSSRLISAE